MTREDVEGFGCLGAMALFTMFGVKIGMLSDGFDLSKAITWGIMVGPGFYGGVILTIKVGIQEMLQELNAARANGQRYPATGPELRNITIVDERHDRVFITSINRFQRPFDRGPIDRYGASGFVVVAPYIFKFSIFSFVKTENDLLATAEQEIDAFSRAPSN